MFEAGLVSRSMLIKSVYAQLVYLLLGADERKLDRIKDEAMAMTKGWDRAQVEEIDAMRSPRSSTPTSTSRRST